MKNKRVRFFHLHSMWNAMPGGPFVNPLIEGAEKETRFEFLVGPKSTQTQYDTWITVECEAASGGLQNFYTTFTFHLQ